MRRADHAEAEARRHEENVMQLRRELVTASNRAEVMEQFAENLDGNSERAPAVVQGPMTQPCSTRDLDRVRVLR